MIQKLKSLINRTSLIVVATLIVAACPASASADTTGTSENLPSPAVAQAPSTDTSLPAADPAAGPATATEPFTPSDQPQTTQTVVPSTTTTAPAPAPSTDAQTTTTIATTAAQNKTTSGAKSGNATVDHNTTAGNAASGSASVTSTTVNSLQSTSGFTGNGQVSNWSTDIAGSHVGDILLDPSQFTNLPVTNSTTPTQLTVASGTNTAINNDFRLDAQSGNATVSDNGSAGDATSGDAAAEANIINMVNSFVGASQTFVGTINIKGNLDGDILLPGTTLTDLLHAQQAQAGENTDITNNTTSNITNTVTASAASGDASVTRNSQGGSATSGQAMTNLSVINLTGQTAVAKNSMVVFVNVFGKWVGFIVDAPSGATSAVLGDGITSAGSNNAHVTNTASTSITNTVSINAQSGDASVSNNGSAGNANSGSAIASANILNMSNDNLSLGGWFGILFINVLGQWTGSFGVDTVAGTLPPPQDNNTGGAQTTGSPDASANNTTTQTAVLAPQSPPRSTVESTSTSSNTNDPTTHAVVLGASRTTGTTPTLHHGAPNWHFAAAGLGFSALLLIVERLLSRRANKRAAAKEVPPVVTQGSRAN